MYCSSVIQFSQCHISIHTSVVNLLCYRIWGAQSCEDS